MLSPTWQTVFRFCGVPDLGRCLPVSKSWCLVADSHHTWMDAYERTQRVDSASEPTGEGSLRTLIERPFGEDAVAWRVAVMLEDGTDRYATGRIVTYSADNDAYLVAYDGEDGLMPPGEAWEQERRKRTAAMRHNPSLAGKSRFLFLAPPGCVSCPRRGLGEDDDAVCGDAVGSDALPGRRGAGGERSGCALGRRPRTWKQELENNVRNTPSRLLYRLDEHTDEVLFVVFSPCGTRLASCSRDLRTVITRVRKDPCGGGSGSSSSSPTSSGGGGKQEDCGGWPTFEQEAVFTHQTAPCRAIWWPVAPYNTVAVSTEDAGWQGASKVEIWEILTSTDAASTAAKAEESGLKVGINSRCIFQGQNRPFDIYAAIFPWPPGSEDPSNLCFLAGWAVFRENEHYVQWLNVWPGPQHPRFRSGHESGGTGGQGGRSSPLLPLARLRLEGHMNYLHCLEVGPGAGGRRILAMTGSTPHLCDEIGIIDLHRIQRRMEMREDAGTAPPDYDAHVEIKPMGERVVLSAKWNQRGDLLLLNTRPYARSHRQVPSPTHGQSRRGGAAAGASAGGGTPSSGSVSFEDLLLRPAPDLSTSMELLVLDSRTLETVGIFDGHFAFTTKESPFLIFTDEWADSDFVASGGEDHRVYVWHRRHRRLIRRLCGHTEPVNAVSWSGKGLLASASDDHSIIVWAAGSARSRS